MKQGAVTEGAPYAYPLFYGVLFIRTAAGFMDIIDALKKGTA